MGAPGRGNGRGNGRGRGRAGSAPAGAVAHVRGAVEARREDGRVQCSFTAHGDDFIDQHW